MCKCGVCGFISGNEADFSVSYGRDDEELKVCRWCSQDLTLLGINFNQQVRLPKPQRPHRRLILGPICTLMEAKTW